MVTKRELQDGGFIVQRIDKNKISKGTMNPLNYVDLSGLSNNNRLYLKNLSEFVNIDRNTISPQKQKEYEIIDLNDFDKSIGEISNIKKFLGGEIHSRKTKFKNGDILFGKLRPYLNQVMIVNKEPKENNYFLGSSEWIKVTPNDTSMLYYLFFVLRSKFTLLQTSASHGSVRPRFNLSKHEIKIPIINKEYIDVISEILENLFAIRKKYKEKQSQLSKRYDKLADIKYLDNSLIKKVNAKNINTQRMDCNYYVLEEIWGILENDNHIRLNDLIKFSNKKINSRFNKNDTIKYITITDIDPHQGEITNWDEKVYKPTNNVANKAPGRAQMVLRENDILLPYLKLSLDSIAWVPKELDGMIGTNGFAVLRPIESNDFGYIYTILRSGLIQKQLKLLAAGTIMEDLTQNVLNKILIYEPSAKDKNKINILANQNLEIIWECRQAYNKLMDIFENFCSGFIEEKKFKYELDEIKNHILNFN